VKIRHVLDWRWPTISFERLLCTDPASNGLRRGTYDCRVLQSAARNHRSWFGRGRELVAIDSVDLFLGREDAVIAFPHADSDLSEAVLLAKDSGAREVLPRRELGHPDDAEHLPAMRLGSLELSLPLR
jgi:hypothetical protein